MIADRTSPAVDSLPSFDLSKLLIGQVVLSSLAALYSDEAPQWNIPLALYGLVTVQAAQVTPESLSTVSSLSLASKVGGLTFPDLARPVASRHDSSCSCLEAR